MVMGESTVHSAQKLPSERTSARIPGRRVTGSPIRDCLEIWHTGFGSHYSLSSPWKAECSEQAYTSVSIDPSTWFCHPTGRFPYLTGEETEAQRNQITCPRPHGIWQSEVEICLQCCLCSSFSHQIAYWECSTDRETIRISDSSS